MISDSSVIKEVTRKKTAGERESGREKDRERERRRSDTKRMKAITINQKKAIINTYDQRDWFCS